MNGNGATPVTAGATTTADDSSGGRLTLDEIALVTNASTLRPAEYDRVRGPLAERLGIRVTALDEEVAAYNRAAQRFAEPEPEPESPKGSSKRAAVQGSDLMLADPDPWPDAVAGAGVLDELAQTFSRFLALPEYADVALALWVMHAHALDAAEVSPILAITSPVLRCGKTTTLILVGALTPRSLNVGNVTAAGVYRTVEKFQPTLLVDEADTFLADREDLRGILNGGHIRRNANVIRISGEDLEPRTFSCWSAKAVASIGKLHATLADRALEVRMRRRLKGERVERLRLDRLGDFEGLRSRAWTWAQENLDALRDADPPVPAGLNDRAADNWRPLLAIADLAGGEWPERARRAALDGGQTEEDQPASILLLSDLAAFFSEREAEVLSSADIIGHLATLDSRPWPEWKHGKPISARGLAKLLKPFGIKPGPEWVGGRTLQAYKRDALTEPLSRYAPPSDLQGPQETKGDNDLDDFAIPKADPSLADTEPGLSHCGTTALVDLADTGEL